jgi:hypothetical protein
MSLRWGKNRHGSGEWLVLPHGFEARVYWDGVFGTGYIARINGKDLPERFQNFTEAKDSLLHHLRQFVSDIAEALEECPAAANEGQS